MFIARLRQVLPNYRDQSPLLFISDLTPMNAMMFTPDCCRDVREQDQDCYMCQINTEKMRKQIGCVTVLVPPDIDQSLSSGDVVVTEGGNTTLSCLAHGQPQ